VSAEEQNHPEAVVRSAEQKAVTAATLVAAAEGHNQTEAVERVEKLVLSAETQPAGRRRSLGRWLLLGAMLGCMGLVFLGWVYGTDIRCTAGDGAACSGLGDRAAARGDVARAIHFYGSACAEDVAAGCTSLGRIYEAGATGRAADYPRASQMYRRGCDGGDARGCYRLGLSYAKGRGVSRNKVRARTLYERGCAGGATDACAALRHL